jgi:choline dehydrogenase
MLMRSGVGPAEHLRDLGIPVVRDMPGVGEHLLDHPFIAPYTSGLTIFPMVPGQETGHRTFIQVMLRARSNQVHEEVDLHFYPREIQDEATGRWMFGFGVALQYARSKGRVRLTSRDPEATLDIDHRYFSDPIDLEAICDGVEIVGRLVTTPPLARLVDLPADAPVLGPRERLREMVREEIGTTFHPSSTCRMGPASDPTAVVDTGGRVYGLNNLRIVDASIFPWGPRCNLHGPLVAVAERMADVIRSS